MNNREAITLLRNLEDSLDSYCELNEEGKTAFRMAIEALNCSEFPNNSDTISRQAAIDEIKEIYEWHDNVTKERIIEHFKQLPPAQPERTPMQELLDVTADRDYWKAQCHSYEMTINRLTESAQPERIIHCKDCEYWNSGSCEYPEHAVNCQDYWVGDIETEAEHFCGYAKRREVTA